MKSLVFRPARAAAHCSFRGLLFFYKKRQLLVKSDPMISVFPYPMIRAGSCLQERLSVLAAPRMVRSTFLCEAPSSLRGCDPPCLSMRNNAPVEHCVAEAFISGFVEPHISPDFHQVTAVKTLCPGIPVEDPDRGVSACKALPFVTGLSFLREADPGAVHFL